MALQRYISGFLFVMAGCAGLVMAAASVKAQDPATPLPAAKPATAYCDQAKSTADFQDCLKRRLDDAQGRLSDIFARWERDIPLVMPAGETEAADSDVLTPESLAALKVNQKIWLAYRDAQCQWEKERAAPALARIEELGCLAGLSEERADRLAALYWRAETTMPLEYGSLARWMNVVAHDYPTVFWRYNDVVEADLDCNAVLENIMMGVELAADGTARVVVALAENPATGLPVIRRADLPLRDPGTAVEAEEETESAPAPFLCGTQLALNVVDLPDAAERNAQGQCGAALQISDGQCNPILLVWDGKKYDWQP